MKEKFARKIIRLIIACCISSVLACIMNTGASGFAAGLAAMAYFNSIE